MEKQRNPCFVLVLLLGFLTLSGVFVDASGVEYVSAVGDPEMRRDGLRLAIEAWNQCNEVGDENPQMGSPRAADCFDVYNVPSQEKEKNCSLCNFPTYKLLHKVTEKDNKLGAGDSFLGLEGNSLHNVDLYASQKELYLGSKCEVKESPNPWHFWMVMLKNGCMNQPLIHHDYTTLEGPNRTMLKGSFYGTWDLDADAKLGQLGQNNKSYFSVTWKKEIGKGSWVFHHVLRTSVKYPWLMLYLRSDATNGFSGGYHYPSRGMSKIIPESPNFKVRFTLNVLQGGGPSSQFYLIDIGSCWKNNGQPCDGDVTSDVTRYSEMIINPNITSWCHKHNLNVCPPYHTFPNGTRVHRTDTSHFPYEAYHLYCSPGNGGHLEEPYSLCDPYSNPQPQEILQILPHPVWGEYGYPTKQGQGWIGNSRTWELDVGRLSQSLYFYQEPGTTPARRKWTSINIGTEIFKDPQQIAIWTVSDFDILIPKQ
ncbi:uncharacterized protein G2W53_002656 [Senna tora]|uniref:DUF7705 domain-containing protein n=1 Tax=Senna tora TaxID=362788 RepID=A0A834XB09_9FABA|nr:uncharacterized protein G2W53_002656 [Senna tora]